MRRVLLFVAMASAPFAQLDSNVVTIRVSRQLSVQPDEVRLTVYVTSPADKTLDQVLAALKGTNIKAVDLTNFYTQFTGLTWVFEPLVAFSDMKNVLPVLQSLKGGLPIGVDTLGVNTAVSAEAAASQQCPYPALINDARLQSAKLAAAVGGMIGPIVSIAPATAANASVPTILAISRLGQFALLDPSTIFPGSFASFLLGFNSTSYVPTTTPGCALSIQFQLRQ